MRIRLLPMAVAVIALSACNSDLDIAAPYKENTIVYAMLNKDSTTQYLRINKAFLGPGNAFTYAQVPDSSEYQPGQLQAVVQQVKNGQVVNTYTLRDTVWAHDPGIFAGPSHKLYYFNATLDSSATYRLEATAKGNHVQAETPIVAKITPTGSILSQPLRLIAPSGGAYTSQQVKWTSSANGKRYDVAYRFRWDDIVGQDTVPRSFVQNLGSVVSNGLGGGDAMEIAFAGEPFFQTVGLRAGDNPQATKRIFRGVDVLWAVAGPALYNYLQLNSPISGLVEERPTYTNVDNGYGLFSTRRFLELTVHGLSAQTTPELAQGQYTAHLHFCIPGSDFDCN
ncbi:MAG: DUF4249 family protein [Bacteroidetes bacterium]|nr:DUF4249 family protein [Bacteroidota bacterium]